MRGEVFDSLCSLRSCVENSRYWFDKDTCHSLPSSLHKTIKSIVFSPLIRSFEESKQTFLKTINDGFSAGRHSDQQIIFFTVFYFISFILVLLIL